MNIMSTNNQRPYIILPDSHKGEFVSVSLSKSNSSSTSSHGELTYLSNVKQNSIIYRFDLNMIYKVLKNIFRCEELG